MNFIPQLFNPFAVGYIYGTSIALTKNGIDTNITESPIITTIDGATSACIYGLSADFASKVIFPEKARYAISGVLIAVAGYNLYKFMKKKYSKKPDDGIKVYEELYSNIKNKQCSHNDVILCECIG